ncbi:MAG: HAD family phosphatase [Butyricicoccus sp.]|nr:HAD family phosphatase [Butyricicoccus sp.]
MPEIRLVATDLDGTLFYDRANITPRDRAMLTRLRERGILLCAATGRELAAVRPAFDRLQLWDSFDYIMHSGGAGIYHIREQRDEMLGVLSAGQLRTLIKRYQDADITLVLPTDGHYYASRRTAILERECALLRYELEVFPDLREVVTHGNTKLIMNGTAEQIEAILPTVLADPDPACQWHRSHDNYIDCYARGVHKGSALTALCEKLGFSAENAMAIGDNENDLQLLRAAGISGCPGDGTPNAKAASDYISCTAAEGAFADFCEHFLF